MHATIKPRSNGIAACRRRPNFKSALPLAKEHKQSFANDSKQALLPELALVAYHPPAVSHATVHRIQPAFESVHTYRLRSIVHPLQLRFQLLREQREVCQILLLSWQAILRSESDTAEQSTRDNSLMLEAKG
jgi:hypothetical protein